MLRLVAVLIFSNICFTLAAPAVTTVTATSFAGSPTVLLAAGGDTLTIVGTGFLDTSVAANSVSVALITCASTDLNPTAACTGTSKACLTPTSTVGSLTTSLTCVTPALTAGTTYQVVYTNSGGTSTDKVFIVVATGTSAPTVTQVYSSAYLKASATVSSTLKFYGTNFATGCSANADGTSLLTGCAASFVVLTNNLATCSITATGATAPLVISCKPGSTALTVSPPVILGDDGGTTLTLTAGAPGGLSMDGGETIQLSGAAYATGCTIMFGTTACPACSNTLHVSAASTLTFVNPGFTTAGSTNIAVKCGVTGQLVATASAATVFYPGGPTVSPSIVSLAGTTVTVSGGPPSGTTVTSAVGVGAAAVTPTFVPSSGHKWTIATGNLAPGVHPIVMSWTNGVAQTTTYFVTAASPVLTSVSPATVVIGTATTLYLTGNYLSASCSVDVFLGGVKTTCGSMSLTNITYMSCSLTLPTSTSVPGTASVVVTCNSVATSTLVTVTAVSKSSLQGVLALATTGVTPAICGLMGCPITVAGTGFMPGYCAATVGSATCTVGTTSSSSLQCTLPVTTTAAGYYPVVVTCGTDSVGDYISTGATFVNLTGPVLSSASPSYIPAVGGVVTFTGQYFGSGCTVAFATGSVSNTATPNACDVTGANLPTGSSLPPTTTTSISCLTGSLTPGTPYYASVTCGGVTTTAGTVVVTPVAPTLTSVSPSAVAVLGTTVTLTGTNFGYGCTVLVSTTNVNSGTGPQAAGCTNVEVSPSGTQITCVTAGLTAAANTPTTYYLSVSCNNVLTTNAAATITAYIPTVSNVASAPTTSLPVLGGLLTVTGNYFGTGCAVIVSTRNVNLLTSSGLGVSFGCTNVAVQSITQLTCNAAGVGSGLALGATYYVSVSCNGLASTETGKTFTVSAQPSVSSVTTVSQTAVTIADNVPYGSSITVTGANFGPGCYVLLTSDSAGAALGSATTAAATLCQNSMATSSTTITCTLTGTDSAAAAATYFFIDIACGAKKASDGPTTLTTKLKFALPVLSSLTTATQTAQTAITNAIVGSTLTINGQYFGSGLKVKLFTSSGMTTPFGGLGTECTNPVITSTTTMTCTLAAPDTTAIAYVQLVPVVVAQVSASTSVTLTLATPSLTSITTATQTAANVSNVALGSTITINGRYFGPGMLVSFYASTGSNKGSQAGTPGTQCIAPVITSTTYQCTLIGPSMAANQLYVVEVRTVQTTPVVSAETNVQLTIGAATVTATTTPLGLAPGAQVQITGTNFGGPGACAVTLNSVNCPSVVWSSTSTLYCGYPGTASAANLSAIVTCGQTASTAFTPGVIASVPTITSVVPSSISPGAGIFVNVTGTNFWQGGANGCIVKIGGTACTTSTAASSTLMLCQTPSSLTVGTAKAVAVVCGSGSVASVSNATIDVVQPTLASVAPTTVSTGGGVLTLTGTNFVPSCTVLVGSTACTVTASTTTSITCSLASLGSPGTAQTVTVTCGTIPATTTSTVSVTSSIPTATAVAPTSITTTATLITITGTNFITGCTVTVGTQTCSAPSVVSATSLTCTTYNGLATGNQAIVVTCGASPSTSTLNVAVIPSVTSVSPATSVSTAAGVSLSVSGTGFSSGCTIALGTTACATSTFVSSTSMTCVTAAMAVGSQNVVVTCGTAVSADVVPVAFAAPTVTSVASASGIITTAAGGSLTISGTAFASACTAAVGGNACSAISGVTATQMTCTTPALTAAPLQVVVTCGSVSSTSAVTVTPVAANVAPTVTAVAGTDPVSTAGSSNLTVTGSGFATGCTVTVGGTNCPIITIATSSSLTCTAPALSAGLQPVVVTCGSNGASTAVSCTNSSQASACVTYTGPIVASASATSLSVGGGGVVTINGTGFMTGNGYSKSSTYYKTCTVAIGAGVCSSPTAVSSSVLTCTAPALPAGAQAVTVTCGGNTSTNAVSLTYVAPSVSNMLPSSVPFGGSTVLVNGSGFASSCTFTVGSTACTSTFLSSSLVSISIPSTVTVGSYTVTATCGSGTGSTGTSSTNITVVPRITSVSSATLVTPTSASSVVITGLGFSSACTATVGGVACTSVTATATTVTCGMPQLATGSQAVVVTCASVSSTDLAPVVVASAMPALVASVNATTPVSTAGGAVVTITGKGLATGCTVTIGGNAATSVKALDPTKLTCVAPANTAGKAAVVITCGTSTITNFSITYSAPTVASLSPSSVPTTAGTVVNITGTGYAPGCTVTAAGSAAIATYVSSTLIQATMPLLQSGTAAVVVKCATDSSVDAASLTVANLVLPTVSKVVNALTTTIISTAGGDTLSVTGTNFAAGCVVTVGGAACTLPVIASPTSLTCTTPAKAAGTQAVVVSCGGNPSTSSVNAVYGVASTTPTVASISNTISAIGGAATITGTNFATGCTVAVGCAPGASGCTASAATCVTLSSTSIYCSAMPVLAPGAQPVVVTCGVGYSSTDAVSAIYVAPSVNSTTPSYLTTSGGPVQISGAGFLSSCSVLFNNTACTVMAATPTSISCMLPPLFTGNYSVVVACGNVASQPVAAFSVAPTAVTTTAATAVVSTGGTVMTVMGTGYFSGCTVNVDNANCPTTYVSGEAINCTTPALASGFHNVSVTCQGVVAPTLTRVIYGVPNTVPQLTYLSSATLVTTAGGNIIQLNGTGFSTGCSVTANGTACADPSPLSTTAMTCVAPPVPMTGAYAVVVTCSAPSKEAISLTYGNASYVPVVTNTSSPLGTGGGNITIYGNWFATGCTARIGTLPCNLPAANTSMMFTCQAPANDVGAQTVAIICNNVTSNTNVSVTYALPTLTSIAPTTISTLDRNVTVTVTGRLFGPACAVTIGGQPCNNTQPNTPTTITCIAPVLTAGLKEVIVRCGAYEAKDLSITYVAPPSPSPSVSPSPTPSPTPSPSPSPVDPAANPNLKLMSLNFNGINTGSLSDSQESDFEDKVDQGVCATMPPGTVCSADAPSSRRRGLLQSSTVPVQVTFAAGTSQEAMQAAMTATTNAINANFKAVFASLLAQFPSITGVTARDLSVYFSPPPPPASDDDDKKKKLAIGLGVGLGVGIPVVAALIFFCVWKSKRSAAGVVAPRGDGSA